MSDPTTTVITSTFCAALGLFVLASLVRKFLGKESPAEPLAVGPDESPDSPYRSPEPHDFPPSPLAGRVPTWFYNPLDLLGMGLVFGVFFTLVWGSLQLATEKEPEMNPGGLLVSIGFQFVSAGIVTALVIARIRPIDWLGLKWRQWYWAFWIVPVSIAVMYGFLFGLDYVGYRAWIESLGVESMQDTVKLLRESDDLAVIGLMAVAAVIAAPLCEEIVFRGYLYAAAKKFAGPWMAGICSAMVFAAAHGSLAALLPLFVFGCVLVILYEVTGSIWAPVAAHFCFNGLTVLLQVGARILDLPGGAP